VSKIRENPKIRALLEARKPYFYIILALALISIWIWDFHLLGLFDREEPRGFIHDFQNLIGGLLAFGAGFFVWIASRETIKSDRKKDLDKYYISKASLASSFLAEFSNIKIQAEKMKLKSILT